VTTNFLLRGIPGFRCHLPFKCMNYHFLSDVLASFAYFLLKDFFEKHSKLLTPPPFPNHFARGRPIIDLRSLEELPLVASVDEDAALKKGAPSGSGSGGSGSGGGGGGRVDLLGYAILRLG